MEIKILLKVKFSKMAYFLMNWNEAGRPFKAFTVQSAKDSQFVGVWISVDRNDYEAIQWIKQYKEAIPYEIVKAE